VDATSTAPSSSSQRASGSSFYTAMRILRGRSATDVRILRFAAASTTLPTAMAARRAPAELDEWRAEITPSMRARSGPAYGA